MLWTRGFSGKCPFQNLNHLFPLGPNAQLYASRLPSCKAALFAKEVTMTRFQTVIRSARFVYSPHTATEMQGFAQVLADSIRARIQLGKNSSA